MKEILKYIGKKRTELKDCQLYQFLRDSEIDPQKRMSFAPHVAFFSMSFGDLMTTVLKRPEPNSELDKLVNAHCSEDDHHWIWYLEDIIALGYNDQPMDQTCRLLWSEESAPVRHLIYSVVAAAGKSNDALFHLILIEILEAGLSEFFELCFREVAVPQLEFLKYFGETHYRAEYDHTVTSWFQADEKEFEELHPLSKFEPTAEVRLLSFEAADAIFERFAGMYDFWYEKGIAANIPKSLVLKSNEASFRLDSKAG